MSQIHRYRRTYATPQEFLDDYQTNLKYGGCQLFETESPSMLALVEVLLEVPQVEPILLTGRVVMAAPGQGFMVQFEGDAQAIQQALEQAVGQASQPSESTGDQEPGGSQGMIDTMVRMPVEDLTGPEGTLHERLRSLPVSEKKRLALSGDREQRMLLARDPMSVIHPFLLKNPRITLDEVLFIARNGQTNPEALELVAENKRWVSDSRIVLSLVLNPKTPLQLALRLLDKLPAQELRRIAKRTDLKQGLLQAARKKVLQPG